MKFNRKDNERNAEFFKALGHPTRLWIVEQLNFICLMPLGHLAL